VSGIVTVAALIPGPHAPIAKLFELALSFFSEGFWAIFDCSGPVVLANVVYQLDALNNMTQNQKACDTKTYVNQTAEFKTCSTANYTVTYCLERLDRLDAKTSAASSMRPDAMLSITSLTMVLLGGAYALFA
jgi:hypothetical protein